MTRGGVSKRRNRGHARARVRHRSRRDIPRFASSRRGPARARRGVFRRSARRAMTPASVAEKRRIAEIKGFRRIRGAGRREGRVRVRTCARPTLTAKVPFCISLAIVADVGVSVGWRRSCERKSEWRPSGAVAASRLSRDVAAELDIHSKPRPKGERTISVSNVGNLDPRLRSKRRFDRKTREKIAARRAPSSASAGAQSRRLAGRRLAQWRTRDDGDASGASMGRSGVSARRARHSRARALALARARAALRARRPGARVRPRPVASGRRPPSRRVVVLRGARVRVGPPRDVPLLSTPPPTTPPSRAPSPPPRPPRRVLVGPRRFPLRRPGRGPRLARPRRRSQPFAPRAPSRASPTGTRSNPAEIARDDPRPGLQAPWTQPRPRPRASRRRVRRGRVRASARHRRHRPRRRRRGQTPRQMRLRLRRALPPPRGRNRHVG